jgi:hypothetical protein
MSQHLIHSQKLELRYNQIEEAKADMDRWGDWYHQELLPVIEEVLDELQIPGKTIRIAKLEIDLGRISRQSDPDYVKYNLKEALRTEILKAVPELNRVSPTNEFKPNLSTDILDDQKDLELLIYLIENGRNPWWTGSATRSGIRSLYRKVFQKQKNLAFKNWLKARKLSFDAAERLTNHLSYPEITRLANWVFPETKLLWQSFTTSLEITLLSGVCTKSELANLFSKILIETYFLPESDRLAPISKWLRNSTAFTNSGKIRKNEVFQPVLEILSILNKPIPDPYLLNQISEKWIASPFISTYSEFPKIISPKEKLSVFKEFSRRLEKRTSIAATPAIEKQDLIAQKNKQTKRLEMEETFPISNSGLVLCAPFLPYFFKGLGLVENKEFISKETQNRAALLIQGLLDERFVFEESDLLLNKILCGIPPEEVIPVSISPTDQEKEEILVLLNTMVSRWTALKSTSGHSMAQGFFSRDGSLRKVDQGYQLLIPRISIDILINRLPWTIGIIKLPWMHETLLVEW